MPSQLSPSYEMVEINSSWTGDAWATAWIHVLLSSYYTLHCGVFASTRGQGKPNRFFYSANRLTHTLMSEKSPLQVVTLCGIIPLILAAWIPPPRVASPVQSFAPGLR